jgi:cysteinyl-tRNA synthetase
MDYRHEMRSFVEHISRSARRVRPGFIVIPQNALELVTENGKPGGKPVKSYLDAIDGIGCEEPFFGYRGDGRITLLNTRKYFLSYLYLYKKMGKAVLAVDYVKNSFQAGISFRLSEKNGFISFRGERSLSRIPDKAYRLNGKNITKINEAENFLYLINNSEFRSVNHFLFKMKKTDYDLLIVDALFWKKFLTKEQVDSLKKKKNGGRRLVVAYLSIGEAEDYRYYWKKSWKKNPPPFLARENPHWKGNYKVKYWMGEWQEIISGREDGRGFETSYLKRIVDAGFDGVYLDIIDAAIYFEERL